ncbi:MAG: polysaccharide biosynthesis/export family protein [Ferruginibacter sp.]
MANFKNLFFFLLVVSLLGIMSCNTTEKATYFYNMKDTTIINTGGDDNDNIIPKNAILSIQVTSLNDDATKIFNVNNTFTISSTTSSGSSAQYAGYLVNADGNIQMPLLGNIKAAGYTKRQLRDNITKMLVDKKLLLDPIVTIRHLNFEVTILGEVARPTVVTVPSEKISLIKALGLAGDITIYGNRENVMLIREVEGKKIVRRINLNSGTFLVSSPFYYLQPNDVLYIESDKNRVASVNRNKVVLPSVLSAMSIVALVVVTFIRYK